MLAMPCQTAIVSEIGRLFCLPGVFVTWGRDVRWAGQVIRCAAPNCSVLIFAMWGIPYAWWTLHPWHTDSSFSTQNTWYTPSRSMIITVQTRPWIKTAEARNDIAQRAKENLVRKVAKAIGNPHEHATLKTIIPNKFIVSALSVAMLS